MSSSFFSILSPFFFEALIAFSCNRDENHFKLASFLILTQSKILSIKVQKSTDPIQFTNTKQGLATNLETPEVCFGVPQLYAACSSAFTVPLLNEPKHLNELLIARSHKGTWI